MNDYRKKIITTFIMIFGLILVITGVTFALLNVNYTAKNVQVISSSGYSITYTEGDDPINAKLKPMSDSEGLISGNDFTFNVKATSNDNLLLTYNVFITLNSSSKMPLNSVKYNLEDITNNKKVGPNFMSTLKVRPNTENNESYYLYTNKFNLLKNVEQIHNYKLTVWATEDVSDVGITKETTDTKQTTVLGGSDFLLSFRVSIEVKEAKDVEGFVLLKDVLLGENNKNVVTEGDGLYKEEYTPSSELQEIYQGSLNSEGKLTTYYYKGENVNNYVSFAGLTWRIIRINEGDNSIRIMLNNDITNGIGNKFSSESSLKYSYYSTNINDNITDSVSEVVTSWFEKQKLENYYQSGVIVDSKFCEQLKLESGSDTSSYTPSFKCLTDTNGYFEYKSKVGLITLDEALYSGALFYDGSNNGKSFITTISPENAQYIWTMSSSGLQSDKPSNWILYVVAGNLMTYNSDTSFVGINPVISLSKDVLVTGNGDGSLENPFIVITDNI